MNIVVFASGIGSNFEAILRRKIIGVCVSGLITDNSQAQAIDIAREYNIPVYVVLSGKRTGTLSENEEKQMLDILDMLKPDLIVFAGFMRIVSKNFLKLCRSRIINIHPSFLPQFKGLNAQTQALDAGVSFSGCSVNFVDAGIDSGRLIIQRIVGIDENDNIDSLTKKILRYEHRILPEAIMMIKDEGSEGQWR